MFYPSAIARVHVRQFNLLVIVAVWLLSWALWYWAVWIGAKLRDKVTISIGDFWPGFFITIAMCFIPAWDIGTNGGSHFSRAFAPSYSGGVCAVSCFKTLVGGGIFMIGALWGIAIAITRFLAPLPHQTRAYTPFPGWLMLVHIVALIADAYLVLKYTQLPLHPGATVGGSRSDDTEASEGTLL